MVFQPTIIKSNILITNNFLIFFHVAYFMMVDILLDILCFVETLHKCLRVLFEFRLCARPYGRLKQAWRSYTKRGFAEFSTYWCRQNNIIAADRIVRRYFGLSWNRPGH